MSTWGNWSSVTLMWEVTVGETWRLPLNVIKLQMKYAAEAHGITRMRVFSLYLIIYVWQDLELLWFSLQCPLMIQATKLLLKVFPVMRFVSIRLYRIIQYQRNIYHWLSRVFGVHGRETHSSLLKHKLLKICTLLSMKYTVSLVPIVQLKMTISLSIVSSFVW